MREALEARTRRLGAGHVLTLEAVRTLVTLRVSLDRARFARLAGRPLETVVNPGSVEKLVAGSFLADTGLILRATPSGRLTLNAVLRELLA